MKAIQSALINLPNVYINGSPTMTSDFVASGFSADNYLTIPASLATNTGTEYVICVITGNDITGDQPFAQASTYVDMSIYEGNLSFYTWSNGTHNTIGAASPNTKYWVKEVVNGTSKSYSYSTDGINYSTPVVKTDTTQTVPTFFTLGVQSYFEHIFTGSIDLKECYIKAGNDIVWRGVKQGRKIKAVYTPSKMYYCWENDSIRPYDVFTLLETPYIGNTVFDVHIAIQNTQITKIGTVEDYQANKLFYSWGGGGGVFTTSQNPQVGDYVYDGPATVGFYHSAKIISVGENTITTEDDRTLARTSSRDMYSQEPYIKVNDIWWMRHGYNRDIHMTPKYKLINQ